MIAGTVVFVYDFPYIQCFIVVAANIGMISYMLIIKPFKEENQQATTVIDEIIIMICVFFFISYIYEPNMKPEKKTKIGWIIICFILFSVIKNFLIVLYFGFIQARRKLRELFDAEDEEKDSPVTSDNNSDDLSSCSDSDEEDDAMKVNIHEQAVEEI